VSTAYTQMISRKLCVVAALLLIACVPLNALALGFGKPVVESTLGEPLRILLPLTALEPNEINDLVAKLAAPSWFQLSGLDYGEINDQLVVSVDTELAAIVISTLQPVSQVVVPLVIELQSPRKVMRKQFTVLVNPSTYDQAVSASRQAAAPTNLPLVTGVSGDGGSNSVTAADFTNGSATSGAALTASVPLSSEPLSARPGSIVVDRGESLSVIVDRFLPNGANRFQGRMAFYNTNPSAFSNGNIHNLIRGAELIVPSDQDILAIPPGQARSDYQSLAQQPIPGEEIAAVSDSNNNDNAGQVESAADSSNQQSVGSGGAESEEQWEKDFRLSLLEVDEDEIQDDGSTTDNNSQAVTDEQLDLANVGEGEQFEMQSFSLRLSAMNAYIVELQEENKELKSRVATLEDQVKALIARDAGDEGSLASITTSLAAQEAVDEDDVALEDALEEALVDAAEEVDTSIVPETDSGLASIEESLSTESESLLTDQNLESDVSETDTLAQADTLNEVLDLAGVDEQVDSESADVAEADATVEQMLEKLDDELNNVGDENSDSVVADSDQSDLTDSVSEPGADAVVRATDLAVAEGEIAPQETFKQGLLEKAKGYLGGLNGPILQLLVALALLAALLFAWLMRRGRKGETADDDEPGIGSYAATGKNVGVTYRNANDLELSLPGDDDGENDDDDQWADTEQDSSLEGMESLDGGDVDLITQSEVYLTYNRPMQAVQALQEEYAKPDSDKFVVGSRLIKVFEKIGSSDERNTAMRNFIVTLNNDIEAFSNSEWDALRFDLDALRRSEQSPTAEAETDPSVDMDSFNVSEQPVVEPVIEEEAPELSLDEGSIDIDFQPEDKTR